MAQPAGTPLGTNPFNTDPSGVEFFVGRQKELSSLRQWLDAIQRYPQHACVIGRPGEGKTSFLQKAQSVAEEMGIISCLPTLEPNASKDDNLNSIMTALLDRADSVANLALRKDWKSGKDSTFRAPRESTIKVDDLIADLQSTTKQVGGKICLICVDDGQEIQPQAFVTLRNTLQKVGRGYMLLLALRNDSDGLSNLQEGQRRIKDFTKDSTDTGVARLFGLNFLSLGPFESDPEASESIDTRLKHTTLKFSAQVVGEIGHITGCYPEPMMVLANQVYAVAANGGKAMADAADLRQAFIDKHRSKVDIATDFCGQESKTRMKVYRYALEHRDPFTALQVAGQLLGGAAGPLTQDDLAADPVRPALDRLVSVHYCRQVGTDQYQWVEPIQTHALRIAVG